MAASRFVDAPAPGALSLDRGSRTLERSPVLAAILAAGLGGTAGVIATVVEPFPLVTVSLTVVFVLAVLRNPELGITGFVAVATILPFAVVPVRLFFSPTFIDVVLTSLLFAWVIRTLYQHQAVRLSTAHLLLAGFLTLAIVSLTVGTAYANLAPEQLRLFLKLLNSLLLFVSTVQVIRSTDSLVRVTRVFILGASIAAVAALFLYALPREQTLAVLTGLGAMGYPTGSDLLRPLAGTETLRATGTSVDPNVLGALLMLAGVLVVGQVVDRRSILPRWVMLACAACILFAIALTYSRSAWVGLATGVAVLAAFRDRRLLLLVPLAAIALSLTPQGQTVTDRFSQALALRDQATLMRLSEYEHAFQLIGQHPILGVGFGNAPRIDQYVGVSSMYLLIAEHTGWLGLGFFVATVVAVLAGSLHIVRPGSGAASGILRAWQAALIAALVASLFDQHFFSIRLPHMAALFWLMLGLLVAAARAARGETEEGPSAPHPSSAGQRDTSTPGPELHGRQAGKERA